MKSQYIRSKESGNVLMELLEMICFIENDKYVFDNSAYKKVKNMGLFNAFIKIIKIVLQSNLNL